MYAKALGWLRRIFNAKLEKAFKEDNSSLFFFFFYFLFIQWFLSNEKATIESTRLRQPSGQKKRRIQNTQCVVPPSPFLFLVRYFSNNNKRQHAREKRKTKPPNNNS
jgi:hypothetical protein